MSAAALVFAGAGHHPSRLMVMHKAAPRSLLKRLNSELRDQLGVSAPEALHLWADAAYPLRGVTLSAHVHKGGVERIAVGSGNWEEAYQEVLAACLEVWGSS